MYRRPRPFFGGLAGGIFLIFLALAFMVHGSFFLPLLFVGLAFSVLFGSLTSGKPQATYGGIMGFIWMLGLAAIFAFNFWWPGILILVGISAIVGTMFRPIMSGLMGAGAPQQPYYQPPQQPQQPYYQPSQSPQQPQQPSYQPYQEGYQPQPQQEESYQEGDKIYPYPQQPAQPSQEYEQPHAQYPQELPPQQ